MRTKQTILWLAAIVLTSFMCQSCIDEKNLYEESVITYSEFSLSLGGEYSMTEKPLGRALPTVDSKDVYGINVAMLTPKDAANPTIQKPYAYGIFDASATEADLKLNLINGYKYRISCTLIKNAKDSLLTNEGLRDPFAISRDGKILGQVSNKFITTERPDGTQEYLYNLENSKVGTTNQSNYFRPTNILRYHGMLDTDVVTANQSQNNVLKIWRRYFSVKFTQEGLQPDCKLEIKIEDAPTIWLSADETNGGKVTATKDWIIGMKNLTATIPTEPDRHIYDNPKVKVTVHKDGEPATTILNYSISFKRNTMHIVALHDINHSGTGSGIGIDVEAGVELPSNDNDIDIPWQ